MGGGTSGSAAEFVLPALRVCETWCRLVGETGRGVGMWYRGGRGVVVLWLWYGLVCCEGQGEVVRGEKGIGRVVRW